jgi:hypothetical protein
MKEVWFVLVAIVILALFGPGIFGCLVALSVMVLGVAAETAIPLAMVLTVALVVGMGIKSWYIDD